MPETSESRYRQETLGCGAQFSTHDMQYPSIQDLDQHFSRKERKDGHGGPSGKPKDNIPHQFPQAAVDYGQAQHTGFQGQIGPTRATQINGSLSKSGTSSRRTTDANTATHSEKPLKGLLAAEGVVRATASKAAGKKGANVATAVRGNSCKAASVQQRHLGL